jgi:dihydrofolate synthase / folylpolyglutamate synthase
MTQTSDAILTRMMTLHPKVIDLTLDRMLGLLPRLGNPEAALPPIVHVAGTNGKGSTQAMIRAGLEQAGLKVHAYTSPHLARFHERIRVAGEFISEADLTEVLDFCEKANGSTNITYFEITTAAAFVAFARVPADMTLLEVGMGGRYDATNVFDAPRLTVITPVSYDHQQYLGETLAEIAWSKAGIVKRGVPCVVGPQEEAAMEVIEAEARKMGAPLIAYGQHWHVWEERGRMIFQDERGLLDLPMPNLLGPHQVTNAGAAIASLRALGHDDAACEAAVTRAYWPARMQRLSEGHIAALAPEAEVWLDGGHNPAGGEAVASTLARMPPRPTYMVCGMLNTKDVQGYLRPMVGLVAGLQGISIPDATATLTAEETTGHARAVGLRAEAAASLREGIAAIVAENPRARILLCGSLYLAGYVLRENG